MTQTPTPITSDLFRAIVTAKNDILTPQYGKVLRPQDKVLIEKGNGRGIRLYDEIRNDGHAYSVLEKRKMKVTGRDWVVEPADDDDATAQAAADLVERALKRIAFDTACNGLLDAILYGYSVAEIEWELAGNFVLPKKIIRHNPARFVFDRQGNPRLLTFENSYDGEALPDRKFIVHRHDEDGSDPYGRGLGRVLFWHVLFKRHGVEFWSNFLEKFAAPTPIAKYPEGTTADEADALAERLANMVQKGALAVPMGTDIDFKESGRDAKASYGDWCSYWDEQTSIAVLGENLTTSLTGDGSRAAAETHLEVSDGIADADSDLLSATLNQSLSQWIIEFNMPGAPAPYIYRPRTKNETAEEALKTARAQRVSQDLSNASRLVAMGFRPEEGIEAYFSEVMDKKIIGLSEADRLTLDTMIKAAAPAAAPAFDGSAMSFAAPDAEHDHGLNSILDQIEDVSQPVIDGWLQMIKSRLLQAQRQGKRLSDVRADLLALYPELDTLPFGEILTSAQAVGELMGRSDVEKETLKIAGGAK